MTKKPTYEELEQRISKLKSETDKLKKSDDLLRLHAEIITNMAEGVYLVDYKDSKILFTNPRFEHMFGYSPGEMLGKDVSIVNAPTDKTPEETAREIMEELYNSGEWHGEVNNIKKDGTAFWCYANVSVFDHHQYGKVLVSVHSDITERKQAEERFRKGEEQSKKYLEAIDSMGMGIFIVDSNYHIRHMNKTMIKWFGDQSGLNCHQSIARLENPCTYCKLRAVIESNEIVHYTPTTPDGRSFDIICHPIQNCDGSISKMEIIRDITLEKKTEEALKEASEINKMIIEI